MPSSGSSAGSGSTRHCTGSNNNTRSIPYALTTSPLPLWSRIPAIDTTAPPRPDDGIAVSKNRSFPPSRSARSKESQVICVLARRHRWFLFLALGFLLALGSVAHQPFVYSFAANGLPANLAFLHPHEKRMILIVIG